MNKKKLIEILSNNQDQLPLRDIQSATNTIINAMLRALINGERIEIRGFGSFSLRYRASRMGRNPKTGITVKINEHYVPHFKPGKNLKEQVNKGIDKSI
ncbi:MAG: integration host factor subunit beta [SAR202 cluster bacterium]|nr:integration host factor subunit beta [SAR202 cluster bacterium]